MRPGEKASVQLHAQLEMAKNGAAAASASSNDGPKSSNETTKQARLSCVVTLDSVLNAQPVYKWYFSLFTLNEIDT